MLSLVVVDEVPKLWFLPVTTFFPRFVHSSVDAKEAKMTMMYFVGTSAYR